jgi:hypothetical protein
MEPVLDGGVDGNRLFSAGIPLQQSRALAREYGCDLAVPNDAGIGNILVYTRLVEEMARRAGKPLNLLTAALKPAIGTVQGELPYPLWQSNPFVRKIVNADAIDLEIMRVINAERDNLCQFSHMITNVCAEYGIVPRILRPALYLSESECRDALTQLSGLRRPILCVHPYGTSSPLEGHPWYEREWISLIQELSPDASVIEVGLHGHDVKKLPTWKCRTTIREMMALVWASDVFVGFDSSVAHIATAFEKPAMVLWDPVRKVRIEERWQTGFGPAALSRWSYPQNRNIMLLGERQGEIRKLAVAWLRETFRSMGA